MSLQIVVKSNQSSDESRDNPRWVVIPAIAFITATLNFGAYLTLNEIMSVLGALIWLIFLLAQMLIIQAISLTTHDGRSVRVGMAIGIGIVAVLVYWPDLLRTVSWF